MKWTTPIYKICIKLGINTPRQWRKLLIYLFMQPYYNKKLFSRKGYCTQGDCALKCCKGCEWLEKRADGKYYCKDWGNRPLGCRLFPIDEKELALMPDCGFYWGKSK